MKHPNLHPDFSAPAVQLSRPCFLHTLSFFPSAVNPVACPPRRPATPPPPSFPAPARPTAVSRRPRAVVRGGSWRLPAGRPPSSPPSAHAAAPGSALDGGAPVAAHRARGPRRTRRAVHRRGGRLRAAAGAPADAPPPPPRRPSCPTRPLAGGGGAGVLPLPRRHRRPVSRPYRGVGWRGGGGEAESAAAAGVLPRRPPPPMEMGNRGRGGGRPPPPPLLPPLYPL